jgi:hypothetical protein
MSNSSIQHLFILHAPGLGGHHLANLVALGDRYKRTVDYKGYKIQTLGGTHYGVAHAHFSNDLYGSNHYLHRVRSNVFNTHLHNFMGSDPNNLYPNKKFMVITLPNVDLNPELLPVKRFFRYNCYAESGKRFQLYYDIEAIYKPTYLEKLVGAPVDIMKAEILFSKNVPAIMNCIESSLDIKIVDKTLFNQIHLQWIEALEKEFAD